MRWFLKILRFLVFELWRWLLVLLAGVAGACVGIWSTGRFDFLRELPNPSIAGVALDKFVIAGILLFFLFALAVWSLLVRPNRASKSPKVNKS